VDTNVQKEIISKNILRRIKYVFSVLTLIFNSFTFGEDCGAWLKHIANDHKVFFLKSGTIIGGKKKFMFYGTANENPFLVAIPKTDEKDWNIKIHKAKSGHIIYLFWNEGFAYSGEFEKSGKCINSSGFRHGFVDGVPPPSLAGQNLTFIYDWKLCRFIDTKNSSSAKASATVKPHVHSKTAVDSQFTSAFGELVKSMNEAEVNVNQEDEANVAEICRAQSSLFNSENSSTAPAPMGGNF